MIDSALSNKRQLDGEKLAQMMFKREYKRESLATDQNGRRV